MAKTEQATQQATAAPAKITGDAVLLILAKQIVGGHLPNDTAVLRQYVDENTEKGPQVEVSKP